MKKSETRPYREADPRDYERVLAYIKSQIKAMGFRFTGLDLDELASKIARKVNDANLDGISSVKSWLREVIRTTSIDRVRSGNTQRERNKLSMSTPEGDLDFPAPETMVTERTRSKPACEAISKQLKLKMQERGTTPKERRRLEAIGETVADLAARDPHECTSTRGALSQKGDQQYVDRQIKNLQGEGARALYAKAPHLREMAIDAAAEGAVGAAIVAEFLLCRSRPDAEAVMARLGDVSEVDVKAAIDRFYSRIRNAVARHYRQVGVGDLEVCDE